MNTSWHFEITRINDEVSVNEYQDGEMHPLKNNGEKSWTYEADFWQWLAKKIGYTNEPISFVVFTNQADADTPPSLFQLHSSNDCYQSIPSGCKMLAFPALSLEHEIPKVKTIPKKSTPHPVQQGTLQSFFINKTKEYQNHE